MYPNGNTAVRAMRKKDSTTNQDQPGNRVRPGTEFRHCDQFSVRTITLPNGRERTYKVYYHATKGWRARTMSPLEMRTFDLSRMGVAA